MHLPKKVVVVGSGIAGLASAVRLSVLGFDVIVFEKNDYPGGKLSHFSIDGFQYDAGPSLFTQPQNIEELFAFANEPIEKYFQYQSQEISFKYFYDDGTIVNAYTDRNKLLNELNKKLGEDEKKVNAYLNQSAMIYQNIGTFFLNNSLHKLRTLFNSKILTALFSFKWKYIFKTMHELNTVSFNNAKTVQLFNRYATYNGSNPYQAPAMLTLIPHLELTQGTFYPKGGMISITNALYQLALKKGVKFQFNSKVDKIIVENNSVKAVNVNGSDVNADIIVSNMDVYYTYKNLLNDKAKAAKVLKQERSSSAFIFYWSIDTAFSQLELHNIFFSNDYKSEFNSLFVTKTAYEDPTVYINITAKCEPGMQAPQGKENWFVMVNAPADIGQDWNEMQQFYKSAILKKLQQVLKTDIEPLILNETVLHPKLIEQKAASYMGSLYGTSSNSKMSAFLRHANFNKQIKGLYFAGGSVHPGGGIPLCLQSAKITTELIKNDFK